MDELSPEARVALDALREDLPDSEARARMRQRVLAASVGAATGTLSAASAQAASVGTQASGVALSAGAVGGTLASLSVSKLVLVVASLGAVGMGARVLHQNDARPAVPEVHARVEAMDAAPEASSLAHEVLTAPLAEPTHEVEPALKSSLQAPVQSAVQSVEPKPARVTRKPQLASANAYEAEAPQVPREDPPATPLAEPELESARRAAPEPTADQSLQAESTLLFAALSAFEAGRPCDALSVLAGHRREFGESARLAPERKRLQERIVDTSRARNFDLETRCNASKGTLP